MEKQMQDWYEEGQEQEAKELCPGGNPHWRDFVEVVRCRDCKHYDELRTLYGCSLLQDVITDDDGYCWKGERRCEK